MASDSKAVSLAQRRRQAETEDSVISLTPSIKEAATLVAQLEDQLRLDDSSPESILKRSLSSKTVISTTSSWALRFQDAAENDAAQEFMEIGRGGCGVVFEQVGVGHVAKRAIEDNPNSLWTDYLTHRHLCTTFSNLTPYMNIKIKIPRCIGWRGPAPTEWWDSNAFRFPADFQSPGHLLFSERILPLPKIIRHALIDLYCDPTLRDGAKMSPGNKHCLVRPYLGQRRRTSNHLRFFSLKNFKIHIDQMEQLNLDFEDFAIQMADALAVVHWKAKLDAYDVEFVLGSAPNVSINTDAPSLEALRKMPPGTTTIPSGNGFDFEHRIIHLWMIDFNQCNDMPPSEHGVRMAVKAFIENAPYFPRPGSPNHTDQWLWETFKKRYLQRSHEVADNDVKASELPESFIDGVIEIRKQQMLKSSQEVSEAESSTAVSGFKGPRVM